MVLKAIEEMFAELQTEQPPIHWSQGLPELFGVEHPDGSLDVEAAQLIIDHYELNGRRPEDLVFLRRFFEDQRYAFSGSAFVSMKSFVNEAPLLTGPAWVARVKDGRQMAPVEIPSLGDLLGGRIEPQSFASIVEQVRFLWFGGKLSEMASVAEVGPQELAEYEAGLRLPHRHEQVVRLAHRLGLDADGLGYAWVAELRRRFRLSQDDDPQDARSRAQVLSDAAGLRLGRLPVGLTQELCLKRVVESIRQALVAGLEEQAVYAVFTELCAQYPQLLKDIGLQASRLGRRRRTDRTLIALRLGSLALQSSGELTRAALLESQAGDAIERAMLEGQLSGEQFRGARVRHYEEALRLYKASGGGNSLWTNQAFARRLEEKLDGMRREEGAQGWQDARESGWYAARPAFSAPELSPVVQVVWPEQRWSGYVNPPPGERATIEFVEGVGYVPLPRPSLAVIAGAAALVPIKVR